MSKLQETSTGQTMYKWLPGRTGKQMMKPGKILAMIMGEPGCGKSHFLESNPSAFIFNLDRTSTSNPNPRATTWPGLDSSGKIEENITWPRVREVIDSLIDAAQKGTNPRPETIVFDSLTNMQDLIKEWVPEGLPYSSYSGKTFREIDGRIGYDFLYSETLKTLQSLRSVGYGVWIVGHTHSNIMRNEQGDIIGTKDIPTFGEGLWKRLAPNFEFVSAISRTTRQTTVSETYTDHRGNERTRKVPVKQTTHTMSFSNRDLAPYFKARAYPEIELPFENGWAAFESAYAAELEKAHALEDTTE